MLDQNSAAIGRFDKSFLIHMIRDFFVILLLVTVAEFVIKAGLVWTNYMTNGEDEARAVADDLAENVREIMRNEGGPVAARTVYPILERNWDDLGYLIAIEPSPVTVRSIEAGFGFTPKGIPAGDWPEGAARAASLDIEAESFCLACHTEARVGEVLGTVTVRNYLARDFALWFEDVQLTAGFAVGKIVLHSVLLFLILRARLEPLMGLRSVVSNLARAYGGLDHRAEIRTADEFGALARDLNLFLDRVTRLVAELDAVLQRVSAVNDDILKVQGDLRDRIDGVVGRVRRLEREAMLAAKREPRLSNAWFDAMRGTVSDLEAALQEADGRPGAGALLEDLRAVVANAEAQIATSEKVFEGLAELGDESERLKGAMAEMTRLEERMKSIVETCGGLVRRIRPGTGAAAE
ncbi:histidine kinase [Rhodosalinus sp. K401]|uniref:histidine kinase n=1 Tax=Rhodosalinus sp. K401 TaxID=3239195 RepID=UPI003525F35D